MKQVNSPSIAVVVASCDKYSDLWKPYFHQFFTHWNDCPFPVYLIANHLSFDHQKVITLKSGDDLDWSSSLIAAIGQISYDYLLVLIDDAFFFEKVPTNELNKCIEFAVRNSVDFLRLRKDPVPPYSSCSTFLLIPPSESYRVQLSATIWKKDCLLSIIKPGESAWEFEVNGSIRSARFQKFYSLSTNLFSYIHGVEKGLWINKSAKKLMMMGHKLDFSSRPRMLFRQSICMYWRLFKQRVFHMFPPKLRNLLLHR